MPGGKGQLARKSLTAPATPEQPEDAGQDKDFVSPLVIT